MFLGIWLDKRLGSSPWFVLICVFVGAGAGFYSIYRKLMGSAKRDLGGGRTMTHAVARYALVMVGDDRTRRVDADARARWTGRNVRDRSQRRRCRRRSDRGLRDHAVDDDSQCHRGMGRRLARSIARHCSSTACWR